MQYVLSAAGLALLASSSGPLRTDYAAERSLRVTTETHLSMETTHFSMTIDGEPMEGRGGGGFAGRGTEESRRVIHVDTVMKHADGVPVVVRRQFEELESQVLMGGGEQSRDFERESPLEGVTLEITREDEEITVRVVDGDEPDDEIVLQGHQPALYLDALLPHGEVAEGDAWEIESEAVIRALGLETQLFALGGPEPGGDGRGAGGGERRGGFAGGGTVRLLRSAEWEGTAKLVNERIEHDGVPCVAIEIELRAEGEQEDAGFGRGRDFAFLPSGTSLALETTYDVTIKGELFFSRAEGRPVALELTGRISLERLTERDRDGSTMSMEMNQEGTFEHSVSVEAVERAIPESEEEDQ